MATIFGIRTDNYIKFYNDYNEAIINYLDMQKKYFEKYKQFSDVYKILHVSNGECINLESLTLVKEAYTQKTKKVG